MDALSLDPARTVVLIVDVQERLCAAMPEDIREEAVTNVLRFVEASRILGLPIIVTEQYPKGLGSTIASVRAALATHEEPPPVLEKIEFDAYRNPNVVDAIDRVVASHEVLGLEVPAVTFIVVGMEAHVCVYQTARSLINAGYNVHVPSDATCSRTQKRKTIAMSLLERTGAVVTCTETVLFDLLGRAGTDDFRSVSNLLR